VVNDHEEKLKLMPKLCITFQAACQPRSTYSLEIFWNSGHSSPIPYHSHSHTRSPYKKLVHSHGIPWDPWEFPKLLTTNAVYYTTLVSTSSPCPRCLTALDTFDRRWSTATLDLLPFRRRFKGEFPLKMQRVYNSTSVYTAESRTAPHLSAPSRLCPRRLGSV